MVLLLLESKDREIYVEKQDLFSYQYSEEKKCVFLSACLLKGERDE